MSRKFKFVLTAMVVIVLMAIYVVGLFLLGDIFNVEEQLDNLFEKDIYGKEYHPKSATSVTLTFDGKAVTEAEEKLLGEYFTYFYAGLGAKQSENITRFYTTQCIDELYDGLAFDYETYLLTLCPIDMSYDDCTVTLNVKRRHTVPKKTDVEIDVEVNASANAKESNSPVVVRKELHNFTIDESEKYPLINKHSSTRPAYAAAMVGYDKTLAEAGFVRSDLNYTFIPKYTKTTLETLKTQADRLTFRKLQTAGLPKAEYGYERDKAAITAINGFTSMGTYGEYEENDANFVSVCIFAGGIPMDAQGDTYDQWKWYDEEISTERKKSGCSKSWFDREYFYRYVNENEGFGMVAYEAGIGDGDLGDVIQLMQDDKSIAEFMVTAVMRTSAGKVTDYLVSNDTYSSVSLLSLGYTEFRLLHIEGYNTANI